MRLRIAEPRRSESGVEPFEVVDTEGVLEGARVADCLPPAIASVQRNHKLIAHVTNTGTSVPPIGGLGRLAERVADLILL